MCIGVLCYVTRFTICVHACVYIYIYIYIYIYTCMCVYVYIYIYIYVCVCIYIYIYTHTHTQGRQPRGRAGRGAVPQHHRGGHAGGLLPAYSIVYYEMIQYNMI